MKTPYPDDDYDGRCTYFGAEVEHRPYPTYLPIELRGLWDISTELHHGDETMFLGWARKLVEYKQFWDIVRTRSIG